MDIKKLNEEYIKILDENNSEFIDWYNEKYNSTGIGSYIITKQDKITNDRGQTFNVGDIVNISNWKSKKQKFQIKAIGDDVFVRKDPFTKKLEKTVKENCIWVEKITTEKGLPIKHGSRNNVYSGSINWVNSFVKVED